MNASDKLPRSGYIQTIYEYLLGLIKKLDASIGSVRSRMNALTALANGGGVPAGTIEAEVVDARVDSSGQVYANLGEAVRGGFATFAVAIEACVKGVNVFLNAANFASLFGDNTSTAGNFNNIGNNKIYPINLSNGNELANSPGANINGMLMTFGRTESRSNGDTQIIITADQAIHSRIYWNNAWTEWNRVLAKLHITDDDAEKRYTADIHIINGKPVLIYNEMGGTS